MLSNLYDKTKDLIHDKTRTVKKKYDSQKPPKTLNFDAWDCQYIMWMLPMRFPVFPIMQAQFQKKGMFT